MVYFQFILFLFPLRLLFCRMSGKAKSSGATAVVTAREVREIEKRYLSLGAALAKQLGIKGRIGITTVDAETQTDIGASEQITKLLRSFREEDIDLRSNDPPENAVLTPAISPEPDTEESRSWRAERTPSQIEAEIERRREQMHLKEAGVRAVNLGPPVAREKRFILIPNPTVRKRTAPHKPKPRVKSIKLVTPGTSLSQE